MDCLKIESRFISRIVEKVIKKSIRKTYGVDADIRFNGFEVSFDGETASVHMDCEAKVGKEDLIKIFKELD